MEPMLILFGMLMEFFLYNRIVSGVDCVSYLIGGLLLIFAVIGYSAYVVSGRCSEAERRRDHEAPNH